jgi:hypothetical protein
MRRRSTVNIWGSLNQVGAISPLLQPAPKDTSLRYNTLRAILAVKVVAQNGNQQRIALNLSGSIGLRIAVTNWREAI